MQTVDLVTRVASGDEVAFNELYQRYVKLVRYIAFQLSHNSADADEIVQEVFIQIHRSIQDLRDPAQLKGWISRITYSKAKMLFRKKKEVLMDDETMNVFSNKREDKREFLPGEKARYQMNLDALNECLHKLQYEYREVLTLFYFAQLSIKEIAQITNKPEGTVKSRMSYAKKNLKPIIESYERKNHMKITFYGTSLHLALLYCGASLTSSKLGMTTQLRKKMLESPFQCIAISVACIAVPVIATSILPPFLDTKQTERLSNDQVVQGSLPQSQAFQRVQYQDKWIETPYDAYKVLLEWAHCDVEMKTKTKEEFQSVEAVYQSLSNYGEGYYRLLIQNDWKHMYNQFVVKQ